MSTETQERGRFEEWAKMNRRDLDLRHAYDERGRYHYDGYLWKDAADAFAIWCAAVDSTRLTAHKD